MCLDAYWSGFGKKGRLVFPAYKISLLCVSTYHGGGAHVRRSGIRTHLSTRRWLNCLREGNLGSESCVVYVHRADKGGGQSSLCSLPILFVESLESLLNRSHLWSFTGITPFLNSWIMLNTFARSVMRQYFLFEIFWRFSSCCFKTSSFNNFDFK